MTVVARRRIPAAIVAGLPYVAAVLAAIAYAAGIGRSSLWFDEAATYQFARLDWPTFWTAIRHGDAFYALYYSFMHLWMNVFGTSETALRMPSALFAAAALPLAFFIVRRLFGVPTAWVALMTLACNPFYYVLARNARPYPIFFFVSLAISMLFLQALERKTSRAWSAYAAVCVLGMYTHLFTMFVIIAHGVYLLICNKRSAWLPYSASAATALIATLPLAWLTVHDDNSQNTWLVRPTLHTVRELIFVWSGSHNLEHLEIVLIAFAAALLVWKLLKVESTPFADSYAFLGSWLLVPIFAVFAISQKKPIYFPNYMISELFAFTALYSRGIALLGTRRGLVPALLLVLALDAYVLKTKSTFEMQSWREGAALLERRAQPGDAILLYPARGFAVFDYYAPDLAHSRRGIVTVYPQDDLPIWRSELEPFAPRRLAQSISHGHRRVWLVANGLSGNTEPGEQELNEALKQYFAYGRSEQLTRLTITELTR